MALFGNTHKKKVAWSKEGPTKSKGNDNRSATPKRRLDLQWSRLAMVFYNQKFENIWIKMKTYEQIWKHMNKNEKMNKHENIWIKMKNMNKNEKTN